MTKTVFVVHAAGKREQQALLHWWSVLADLADNRRERGKTDQPDNPHPLPPFYKALELALYDAYTDSITWRGETKTIEEINRLER